MSKLEETNAMIDGFNDMLHRSNNEHLTEVMEISTLIDIAKSLAIIADAVSKEDAE